MQEELDSGTYTFVDHRTKSEFEDFAEARSVIMEEFKKQIKQVGAEGEVKIESVNVIQVTGPETIESGWIWNDEPVTVINEDHTDIIIVFSVHSPFAILTFLGITLIVIGVGVVIGMLISGALEPIAKFIYENPLIIGAGILIILMLIFGGLGVSRRRRRD